MQMSVPVEHRHPSFGVDPLSTRISNWTINVPDIRTVKVSNISQAATERDIMEFFSFSGRVHFIDMQRATQTTRLAYVTFKNSQGADRAILLSGATIAGLPVSITPAENYYHLPPHAPPLAWESKPIYTDSTIKNAEELVSTMLAKGFVLGKDALNRAKVFDERHHLTSNASATLASIDRRMGLTEKLNLGTAAVNGKVKEMDEQYQVFGKTKLALAVAEQSVSSAGSVIMSNRYVSTGASWFSSAFNALAKAAEDVSTMTKEKVEKAEEEKKDILFKERAAIVTDFASIHFDDSAVGELPVVSLKSDDDNIPRCYENLV